MSSRFLAHHTVAPIDIDDELQGEVRLLIERIDRQVALRALARQADTPQADRPPLNLTDADAGGTP
jgi:hypothetical protein